MAMSHERAQAFIQQVTQSETLKRSVLALHYDLNGLLALAAESGFHFNADEWRSVTETMESAELSESDLATASGGLAKTPSPPSPIPIPYPNRWK
jgi:predicted ribosomally synthesized peptide with nif11-like leader